MDMTIVSFPSLGIEKLEFSKIAFTLFGTLEVRWYGIMLTLGIVVAFLYTIWRGKRNEGVVSDDVMDIGIVTVICGIIGARAYYVLTTLDSGRYNSFVDVIAIWNGGIAIYGAVIGGALGIVLMCAIKKISWRKLFDMAAPGVLIAQAIGRWGNFFNGEAHGSVIGETTKLDLFGNVLELPSGEGSFFRFFRMGLEEFGGWVYYHPTFLYESVWNLIGFIIINIFYKRKRFHGQVALMYFSWYGLGRTFIEGFRTDSLYIPGTGLRISQCLGLACFVVTTAMLIVFLVRNWNNDPFADVVLAEEKREKDGEETSDWTRKLSDGWKKFVASVRKKDAAEEAPHTTQGPEEGAAEAAPEADTQAESKTTAEEESDHGTEN